MKSLENRTRPSVAGISASYDLHCHVLPAWDDGPKTLSDSLALVERALRAGTRTLYATPHVGRTFKGLKKSSHEIAAGVECLQSELDARGLEIQILPGAEVMMGAVDISPHSQFKETWTYGQEGKFLLIESPMQIWPPFGNHVCQEILRRGVTPVLAHPERYLDVQKSLEMLQGAITQGALVQITAGALVGEGGRGAQKCALRLLEAGWVHFVASDAHNASHTMPGEVIDLVVERIGEARARQIFEENPAALVAGMRLPRQISPENAAPTGWKRFFGR